MIALAMKPVSTGELAKVTLHVAEGDAKTKTVRLALNPTDYSLSRSADWGNRKNSPAAVPARASFQGVKPYSLKMSAVMDAAEAEVDDIGPLVEALFSWLQPMKPAKKAEPPLLALEWGHNSLLGGRHWFLSQVEAKCTLFARDGAPLRATVSLTLEEQPAKGKGHTKKRQNPTSGADAEGRYHIVRQGDTLDGIAYQEYGDSVHWRVIAQRNNIDDPLRLSPGATLLIPTEIEGW